MSFNEKEFKQKSRKTWSLGSYSEVASILPPMSAHLIRSANVKAGDSVLDVACGPGNTAITAGMKGARVIGIDITPELLEKARLDADIANVGDIDWREGDVENLPFDNNSFDVVLSSVGHMFSPRPEIVTKELLRVTKPSGRISFTTWPPEHVVGKIFAAISKYISKPMYSPPSPMNWGITNKINEYFADSTKYIHFERGVINVPLLSANHYWYFMSSKYGPVINAVKSLNSTQVEELRIDFVKSIEPFIQDNILKLDYLLTTMIKKD